MSRLFLFSPWHEQSRAPRRPTDRPIGRTNYQPPRFPPGNEPARSPPGWNRLSRGLSYYWHSCPRYLFQKLIKKTNREVFNPPGSGKLIRLYFNGTVEEPLLFSTRRLHYAADLIDIPRRRFNVSGVDSRVSRSKERGTSGVLSRTRPCAPKFPEDAPRSGDH